MREAIGGTWIFTIVIVFIVLFSGYLAISVNYSKAFKVKNQIVSLIEKNEGLGETTQKQIAEYLDGVGYAVYGSCVGNNSDGQYVYEERGYLQAYNAKKYKYCVTRTDSSASNSSSNSSMTKSYYTVKVWFRLDLPILGNLFTFPVTGQTKGIYFATPQGQEVNNT